jgi:23S rRNA (adenine2503-C2)-methyltransferase
MNLKGLTLSQLEDFAESIDERRYRGKQLFEWLYRKRAASFHVMTSFSKELREKFSAAASIDSLTLVTRRESREDGTTKYLLELPDGKRIESVLIPPRTAFNGKDAGDEEEQKRLTLCVSTQVGCALDCAFCATASMGIIRNLTTGEIIDQLIRATNEFGRKITNIVYMGMGEPLMNYSNVMNSAEIISTSMGIAARRIAISTAGWVPGIKRMADEKRKMRLAISLHSLDEKTRSLLMPINQKYSLPQLIEVLEYYYKATKIRITFEYILFDGLNDQETDLRRIIKLGNSLPCKINIIPFHGIDFIHPTGLSAKLRPTPQPRVDRFVRRLRDAHLTVFVRSSAGEHINAACGQLAVNVDHHQTRRKIYRTSSLLRQPVA